MILSAKIDVTKILKDKMFNGAKGTYLDISILENKNGTDQYGNDFMVVQDIGKEARERGEKGPILGNGKYRVRGSQPAPAPQESSSEPRYRETVKPQENLDEDVPF